MPDPSTKLGLSLPKEDEVFNLDVYRNNLAEIDTKVAAHTELEDLAGTGRTTETVKGNADAIAEHLAETMPHRFTDGITTYRYGLSVQNGEWGILWEEVI